MVIDSHCVVCGTNHQKTYNGQDRLTIISSVNLSISDASTCGVYIQYDQKVKMPYIYIWYIFVFLPITHWNAKCSLVVISITGDRTQVSLTKDTACDRWMFLLHWNMPTLIIVLISLAIIITFSMSNCSMSKLSSKDWSFSNLYL